MTSPQGRDRITAEDLPLADHALGCRLHHGGDACNCLSAPDLAASLNDPAIRRLVVRKCVEAMGDKEILALFFDWPDEVPCDAAIDRAHVLAYLCPEETPR